MRLGRVEGTVWATRKDAAFEGVPLQVVQPVDADGTPSGSRIVAANSVAAAPGELIFYVTSREAAFPWKREIAADATIVGIVEGLHVADDPSTEPRGGAREDAS